MLVINKLDKYITTFIFNLKIKKFSDIFSKYIIYFNLFINIILLNYINKWLIFYRYFIELFIINFCCKCLLDRPRPRDSLFLTNIIELMI